MGHTVAVKTPRPEFEFAVLGAGAIGSILGAHLARAGHRVVMLARGRRAEQIRAEGLRLTGLADFALSVPTLTAFYHVVSAVDRTRMERRAPGA